MLHYFASDGGNAALKRAAEDRQGWRYRENVLNMWPRCESCKHADLKTSKLKISQTKLHQLFLHHLRQFSDGSLNACSSCRLQLLVDFYFKTIMQLLHLYILATGSRGGQLCHCIHWPTVTLHQIRRLQSLGMRCSGLTKPFCAMPSQQWDGTTHMGR